jgi:hypothetical protein
MHGESTWREPMKVSVTPWDLFPRVRPLTGRILSLWDILLLKEMGTEGEISKREGGGCPVMGRGDGSWQHNLTRKSTHR